MLKASFVIPTYQSAAWAAHAIESCQKQSYPLIEIVVVDDCSTDSTPKLLDYISNRDRRVKVIRNEKNLGRSASRNLGNAAATGEILLVLDADDIAYPDRAKLTVEKMKKADFVYGTCDVIDCIGNKLGINYADVLDKEKCLKDKLNYMTHSGVAYSKALAMRYPYREGELSDLGIDDWSMQTEVILSSERIDFIPTPIGAYRELSSGISKTRDEQKVAEAKDKFIASLKVAA